MTTEPANDQPGCLEALFLIGSIAAAFWLIGSFATDMANLTLLLPALR